MSWWRSGYLDNDQSMELLDVTAEELGTDRPTIAAGVDATLPLGRGGTADEAAETIAFLASARASYISGAVVAVDGGFSGNALSTWPSWGAART